ncbi:Asp-tRNA(Asn)/Glu-tRNA(Gln) amidotransferase subunit GatB [Candidatus Margulisiibacteriota bacterium]
MKYETVIGLEIHAQLATESKMFCGCSTKFGAEPNTNICPVCTGQPGVLPVTNKKAIELAIKTAIALNCKIEPSSIFARKNYFYPDLPKDYQISQFELPLATKGRIDIEVDGKVKKIGITRVHLEEDAGKLVHQGADRIQGSTGSLVDFNRTGTPLMEIVSEPDIRSPKEAAIYMQALANLLQYIGVSDAKMAEGSLRCDANLSIREFGSKKLGTKSEVKNMNSFKAVEKALAAEEKRHRETLEAGGQMVQETVFFDETTETTSSMRSKESSHDYRYFPEPDLVPIEPDKKWIDEIKKNIGELPSARIERFVDIKGYNLPLEDAKLLVSSKETADYFEESVFAFYNIVADINSIINHKKLLERTMKKLFAKLQNDNFEISKHIKNRVLGDILAYLNTKKTSIASIRENLPPQKMAEITKLINDDTINRNISKTVMDKILESGKSVKDVIAESGMTQVSDEGELTKIVQEVLKNNPKPVEQYKAGKKTTIGFLVGQVMKASKGRANPGLANKLLKQELDK